MDTLPQLRSHADAPSLTQASDGVAFGQFLRRARERRGLTLRQIADETKIPERHLNALEQGNLLAAPRAASINAPRFAPSRRRSASIRIWRSAEFERALGSSEEPDSTSPVDEETRPRALAIIGVMTFSVAAALDAGHVGAMAPIAVVAAGPRRDLTSRQTANRSSRARRSRMAAAPRHGFRPPLSIPRRQRSSARRRRRLRPQFHLRRRLPRW